MNLKALAQHVESVAGRAAVNQTEPDDDTGLAVAFDQSQRHYTHKEPCGAVTRVLNVGPAPSVREARGALADALAALPQCNGDALLTLEEAAKILGYSPSGLRKVVNRTKAGKPGIKFAQIGNGPIKFRREWLDEFTVTNMETPRPRAKPKHW